MKETNMVFLFDVDGLMAETPHEEAWKQAAVDWGIISSDYNFTSFYAEKVAGEPGNTGAGNILEYLKDKNGLSYYERENIVTSEEKFQKAEVFRSPTKQRYVETMIDQGDFRIFYDIAKIILSTKLDSIPLAAVSSSENAANILSKIRLTDLAQITGISYPVTNESAVYTSIFDTTVLGAISYWHGVKIEKINHYAMAFGKLLGTINPEKTPYAIVFEDAPKGIAAVSQLGFYAIGVSRKSTTGLELASKDDLYKAGASLVYNEEELARLNYETLKTELLNLLPRHHNE